VTAPLDPDKALLSAACAEAPGGRGPFDAAPLRPESGRLHPGQVVARTPRRTFGEVMSASRCRPIFAVKAMTDARAFRTYMSRSLDSRPGVERAIKLWLSTPAAAGRRSRPLRRGYMRRMIENGCCPASAIGRTTRMLPGASPNLSEDDLQKLRAYSGDAPSGLVLRTSENRVSIRMRTIMPRRRLTPPSRLQSSSRRYPAHHWDRLDPDPASAPTTVATGNAQRRNGVAEAITGSAELTRGYYAGRAGDGQNGHYRRRRISSRRAGRIVGCRTPPTPTPPPTPPPPPPHGGQSGRG